MSELAMERRLTGKHIGLFLLAFFAVIAAVNVAFMYFALSTRPGEEKGASYEIGLRYNNILDEQRTQDALKWRHETGVIQGGRLRIAITNDAGTPVAGLAVTGTFGRPASDNADRTLTFKEVDAGLYEAGLGEIALGSWVLLFSAEKKRPGDPPAVYRVKERLWLSQAH